MVLVLSTYNYIYIYTLSLMLQNAGILGFFSLMKIALLVYAF